MHYLFTVVGIHSLILQENIMPGMKIYFYMSFDTIPPTLKMPLFGLCNL